MSGILNFSTQSVTCKLADWAADEYFDKISQRRRKMNIKKTLEPGLYLTATPIGCLEDITLRALRVLRSCDEIYCEDTRVSRKLLAHYNISTPLATYHDHNADAARPKIIQKLQRGATLALISDAGMPLIADPGFKLVRDCFALGIRVTSIPGASAFLTASSLSGFPTAPLTFLGFASRLNAQALKVWEEVPSTLAFFEAPHKLLETLGLLQTYLPRRKVAILRELTKVFEERITGSYDEVYRHFLENPPRGEIVIVLSPPSAQEADWSEVVSFLQEFLKQGISLKNAVEEAAQTFHLSKKSVYQYALQIFKKGSSRPEDGT